MRDAKSELRQRKIEMWWSLPLGFLFILLTWGLFRFYSLSATLPLSYALFFFGLVNLNVLVLLLLIFFLGRNLVKMYDESKPRLIGKTLKARLFLAFVSFAFIPTCLMFSVSVFYINNSFDRWFANRTKNALKKADDLSELYLSDIRSSSFYAGERLLEGLNKVKPKKREVFFKEFVSTHGVDAVEFYDFKDKKRIEEIFEERRGYYLPPLDWSEVEIISNKRSLNRKTEQGEWLSSVLPVKGMDAVVVVSRVLPFTYIDTVEVILNARADFQSSKDFKFPLKSTYRFILVSMTLVILAFGGWFSLYLAQSLSRSLLALGSATRRISKGDFKPIKFQTGMIEINRLVENFNVMASQLETSRYEINQSIDALDKHSRYMDTVLSQVSSGVVSFDSERKITLLNERAAQLLKIRPHEARGKKIDEVLPPEVCSFIKNGGDLAEDEVLTEEVDISLSGKDVLPLQIAFARLEDHYANEIGSLLTFDEVTLLRENQRVKAWKEVASRVAHEIKNPLTPVKLSAERLHRKFSEQVNDPTFTECIQTIISQVDLIKDMVNEFNQFARFPKLSLEEWNLVSFFDEVISLYKTSHPEIIFDLKVSENLKSPFDKDQMRRVFINLIENSIDAINSHSGQKSEIAISILDTDEDMLRIRYSDSGPGVLKKNINKVFENKFSTKSKGRGLGLPIVKRIIEDHGGRISLEDEDGTYSVFIIDLPRVIRSKDFV